MEHDVIVTTATRSIHCQLLSLVVNENRENGKLNAMARFNVDEEIEKDICASCDQVSNKHVYMIQDRREPNKVSVLTWSWCDIST